ncbi:MAG: hypothetical protein ABSH53_14055 [Holophaga sp.]
MLERVRGIFPPAAAAMAAGGTLRRERPGTGAGPEPSAARKERT